jgi:hypothetical protein
MSVLVVGFGLGFFVAAQLGPLSLFAIRSTLRSGAPIGLAIGAGVAVTTRCTPPPGRRARRRCSRSSR